MKHAKFEKMSSFKNGKKFQCSWQEMKKGIEKIYSNNISKAEFLQLYTSVYEYCTYDTYGSFQLCQELYSNLASFFQGYLQVAYRDSEDLFGEQLLQFYMKLWEDYRFSSQVLGGVYEYLNRHWVRRERQKRRRVEVLEVYTLALMSWKNYILEPLKKKMCSAILKLIEKERNGTRVDTRLISTALNSYVEVGTESTKTHSSQTSLRFYKEYFEIDFLLETESFYATEGVSFILENPALLFVRKVVIWFSDEQKRAQLYLHDTTLAPLMNILDHFLIIKHVNTFLAEFKILLESNQKEDLKIIYQLLSRISKCQEQLKIFFEEYITTEGLLTIENLYQEAARIDYKTYIDILLHVYQKLNGIIMTTLESEAIFTTALNNACKIFINKNAVTESSGLAIKSAEFLAKYCDSLLKKVPSNDSEEMEIMDNLNRAMIIFKYLEEKDTFVIFHTKMFAKRLLQQMYRFRNDDSEKIIMSKIKELHGFQHTSKLQKMLTDMYISQDLISQFEIENGPLDFIFTILVIGSSSWPFNKPDIFSLPQELEQSVQKFSNFYNSRFEGRKLTWLHSMSTGELVSQSFDKLHIFQASALQIAVLLQFNTQIAFSFEELQESTEMRPDILLQVLGILVKVKLLKETNGNPITASSSINLNVAYRSKKLKVNINLPMKPELKIEQQNAYKQVNANRKILIQTAIVRIAKARRIVEHQVLLSEVISQLSSRFQPEIPMIEKCIDLLIEKDYLSKVAGGNSYSYIE